MTAIGPTKQVLAIKIPPKRDYHTLFESSESTSNLRILHYGVKGALLFSFIELLSASGMWFWDSVDSFVFLLRRISNSN